MYHALQSPDSVPYKANTTNAKAAKRPPKDIALAAAPLDGVMLEVDVLPVDEAVTEAVETVALAPRPELLPLDEVETASPEDAVTEAALPEPEDPEPEDPDPEDPDPEDPEPEDPELAVPVALLEDADEEDDADALVTLEQLRS